MKKIIAVSAFICLFSCEKDRLTQINSDPNSYYTTVPSTTLTYAEKNLADYLNTPSVNINNLRLTMQYWQETTYLDESRYNFATRSVSDNVWLYLYVRTLKNLDQSKKLVSAYTPTAAETVSWPTTMKNQLAILDILEVYTYQVLVDTYGNIPYSQSLDIDANPLPAYDDGKTIYSSLITRLQADIANLDATGASFSSGDAFYNGKVSSWKKFGNSLLLKLGIAIADSDPTLAQSTCQAAINGGVFTSGADDCSLPYLIASPNYSQLYANLVANGRTDFVAGKPIVDQMNSTGDARRGAYFQQNLHYVLGKVTAISGSTISYTPDTTAGQPTPVIGDSVFKGAVLMGKVTAYNSGSVTISGYDGKSIAVGDVLGYNSYYSGGGIGVASDYSAYSWPGTFAYSQTTPGIIMNYTEVAFYLAEASARWGIGGDASTLYNNALTASFLQWGYKATDAATYIIANPYNAANWKSSIGTQAWIAMYNQPMQSWNFWRRLDTPKLLPADNAVNDANGKVPVRLQYPVSEKTTNPSNYSAGAAAIGGDYLYSKLFWDKY